MLVSIPCVGCIEFYSRKYNAHVFIDLFHKLIHHLNNKLVFKTIEKKTTKNDQTSKAEYLQRKI